VTSPLDSTDAARAGAGAIARAHATSAAPTMTSDRAARGLPT